MSKPSRAPSTRIAEFQLSHARNGPHLPLPVGMPGWPFQTIGQWKQDVNAAAEAWRRDFREWRDEHLIRMGYSGANYERPEFRWTQRNFVHAQMMVEDRYFYDPVKRRYTVNRYLDDLERRYGGIDSVLIWILSNRSIRISGRYARRQIETSFLAGLLKRCVVLISV